MTFKEKLKIERPEMVNKKYVGGCNGCPHDYGYEEGCDCNCDCEDCWDREMPTTSIQKATQAIIAMGTASKEYASSYEQGLQDAWELSKKVFDMDYNETVEVFDCDSCDVMKMTPQEALAKLKAYEEAKEIKVGDVVESNINQKKYLVLEEMHDGEFDFLALDIEQMEVTQIVGSHYYFKKTGKHIDIESILKQIGGAE